MNSKGSENAEALIAMARQDGGESLGDLLERYRNYLYLLARTQIDLHLAVRTSPSDIVQETFLQAAREFERFEGVEARQLIAWLRKILVNNIVTSYRENILAKKRDARRELPLAAVAKSIDESSLLFEQTLARSTDAPDKRMHQEEQATQVADLLAELEPQYREIIILRNLEGMSFKEIATQMDRSHAAVRKLWTRAISRLRVNAEGDSSNE